MFSWNRFFIIITLFLIHRNIYAYCFLTHEAFVNEAWDNTIEPLLIQKFPEHNTVAELLKAKAYAYGGALMPDMGRHPNGNELFPMLTHYVRTGDFIRNLLTEAKGMNEYAFALGALSHYSADNLGHPIGVNRAVALTFPKLKKKFGDTVTFNDHQNSHRRIEFSYDVLEVARGNYAPEVYQDFIGFEFAEDLTKRAFQKTYCLDIKLLFHDFSVSINSFRIIIFKGYPILARAAWKAKKKKIKKEDWDVEKNKYLYEMDMKTFQNKWGKSSQKHKALTGFISGLVRIVPKVGSLKTLNLKLPTQESQIKLMESFQASLADYDHRVKDISSGDLTMLNNNLDTGKKIHEGDYCLADLSHTELLILLRKKKYKGMTEEFRQIIITYFEEGDDKNNPYVILLVEEIKQLKLTNE